MSKVLPGTKATRMELLRLKTRLKLANRGHDLLKEKRDALIMEFFNVIEDVKKARHEVNVALENAFRALTRAKMSMGVTKLAETAMQMDVSLNLETFTKNIIGVRTPIYKFTKKVPELPYNLVDTSPQLDDAIDEFNEALNKIIVLAEKESEVERLVTEIERTKRRVNALKYIVIPRLEATVRFIKLQLEEHEREDFFRLKRVKDMLEAGSD